MGKKKKYTGCNRVTLLKGGEEYFSRLVNLVDNATHSIHIQKYIIDDDETGSLVAAALMRAAQRGLEVYLVADGYASQWLSSSFIRLLKQAGVRFRYFEPLLRSSQFYFGRRMHHKIVVVDARFALVGGINIANRYNDVKGIAAWLDFAVLIEGEAALELFSYCCVYWQIPPEKNEKLLASLRTEFHAFHTRECSSVRIRRNDWVKGKHEVWNTYFSLFNIAQESITIICSYFLPGHILRKRLSRAARRGVRVKVILAGPSDIRIAKYAERYLYGWMLKHGIEIYEYQPTVLHAKMAVADRHWVTIGSFNINNISAYASLELNADIRNRPFATQIHQMLDEIIDKDCIRITGENSGAYSSFMKKLLQKGAYEVIRLILNISTFYFKRE